MHKISEIRPFNDIYINCYFSALLPIIVKYERNIYPFILSEFVTYNKSEGKQISLNYSSLTIEKSEKIFADQKLKIIQREIYDNKIVVELKKSLYKSNPVILLIDSYYEPLSFNTYQKNHSLHEILVFGFNNNDRHFDVIEHEFWESTLYKEQRINYADLERSYNSIFEYKQKSDCSYIEVVNEDELHIPIDTEIVIKSFFMQIDDNYDSFMDGLKVFEEFLYNYNKLPDDYDYTSEELDTTLVSLNKLRKNKETQLFCFKKWKMPDFLIVNLENTLNPIKKLWGILTKHRIAKSKLIKYKKISSELLIKIFEMEKIFYESIYAINSRL